MGSGCGAVGRAVAYDTRGPGFESSHRQLLLNIYLLLTVCRKDENKEKRSGMAHFFINNCKKSLNSLSSCMCKLLLSVLWPFSLEDISPMRFLQLS